MPIWCSLLLALLSRKQDWEDILLCWVLPLVFLILVLACSWFFSYLVVCQKLMMLCFYLCLHLSCYVGVEQLEIRNWCDGAGLGSEDSMVLLYQTEYLQFFNGWMTNNSKICVKRLKDNGDQYNLCFSAEVHCHSLLQWYTEAETGSLCKGITMKGEDPQVFNVQRIRGSQVLHPKWDMYILSPSSKARGSSWKKQKGCKSRRG